MLLATSDWKHHVIIFAFLHFCVYDTLSLKMLRNSKRREISSPVQGFNIVPENDYNSDYEIEIEREPDQPEPGSRGSQDHDGNEESVRSMIEEKFKFRNDETSTRYRISKTQFRANPESKDDRDIATAFRSYAARRIVGGMETSISMYPYNVAISRKGIHWCGGSIIDEQWVLTAGHCFEAAFKGGSRQLNAFIVRAGSSFNNKGGYQARVNKVFFPKTYNPGGADYDFSLIRLDRPMPVGRNIAVLNLPSKDYVMKEEDMLVITGWGSTDPSGHGYIPDRLRFVPVPVMRDDSCQKSYGFEITERMLCAGYASGGKDACNHDSGGPAVRDGVLLGVVSFGGKQCGDPRSPGVYSRVSEVTKWVENTISQNEADKVPELREKIIKARARERELQKFKARVEDKKNKIKSWLRDTLKSPKFISLAKKKLQNYGFLKRKKEPRYRRSGANETLDDKTMDEINLSNQIEERILLKGEERETNITEILLRALAFQDVIMSSESSELNKDTSDASIEALIAYIAE